MHWNTTLLPTATPFVALRRDFERKLGLDADSVFAGMSVSESPSGFTVQVDVPGIPESDISVTLQDDHLIIEGERKRNLPADAKELFSDRTFRKFRRVLRLQEPVDKNAIEAELSHGVLTLQLRRIPEVQPQKITIRTA